MAPLCFVLADMSVYEDWHEGRLDRSAEETASKGDVPLGMLGVIGPQRMDYSRVIPLVGYFSDAVTRKLLA